MNGKEFAAAAKAELEKALGKAPDPEIFKKAIEKAKRHMRNKYGRLDYDAEHGESGYGNVRYFYSETLAKPDGRGTFNHAINDNFRSQG